MSKYLPLIEYRSAKVNNAFKKKTKKKTTGYFLQGKQKR